MCEIVFIIATTKAFHTAHRLYSTLVVYSMAISSEKQKILEAIEIAPNNQFGVVFITHRASYVSMS